MRIDPNIEAAVREAYRAVVAEDGDRMVRALDGLSETDARTAIAYGVFVCGYIVNEVHPDGPSESEMEQLAAQIIEGESGWINLGSPGDLAKFLAAAGKGDTSFEGVPRDDIIGHTFVCGGHLLATYRLEDQHWWNYLDEIWTDLEAAPEPT